MAKEQLLEYTVWLRDAAKVLEVQQWIATGGGDPFLVPGPLISMPTKSSLSRAMYKAPYYAGVEFDVYVGGDGVPGLPYVEVGQPVPSTGPGYITSGWFTKEATNFPRTQRTFEIETGWWIFGSKTIFYWAGRVALAPGVPIVVGTPLDQLPAQAISKRYWIHGFEALHQAETGGGPGIGDAALRRSSPAASRTGDGLGARYVAQTYATLYDSYELDFLRPPITGIKDYWERFYIRPLRFPSTTVRFWHAQVDDVANGGFDLGLTTTGQLAVFGRPAAASDTGVTLISTFGQTTLNQWTKLDLFLHCEGSRTISMDIRVDGGVTTASAALGPSEFSEPGRIWDESRLGPGVHGVDHDLEIDFDDWIGAAIPLTQSANLPAWNLITPYVSGNVVRYNSLTYVAVAASTNVPPTPTMTTPWKLAGDPSDLSEGSHVVRVVPDGFGPAHDVAAWTGDVRALAQRVLLAGAGSADAPQVTTTTSGAVLEVTLPLATTVDNNPQSLGIAAWRVVLNTAFPSTPLDGALLGYQVASETPVTVPIVEASIQDFEAITGQPATFTLLPKGTSLRLRFVNAPDTRPMVVQGLAASVELIGAFGPEDRRGSLASGYPRPVPVHLAPWPNTPWSHDANPLGPIIIRGATYVGNGTGQDLLFPLPPAFLLIRPLTAPTGDVPTRWWPAMNAAHQGSTGVIGAGAGIVHVDQDYSFVPAAPDADQQLQFRVRLAHGADTKVNALGVTYQLVALMDPAQRFSSGFATAVRPIGATSIPGVPRTWPLDDFEWVPEVSLHYTEIHTGTAAPGMVWKTPGNAVDGATGTTGILAAALTFGTGTLTIGAPIALDQAEQLPFVLFRRNDGNVASNGQVVFAGSYLGDGAASRTITFGTTGKRPLYAQVGAVTSATQYHRDPSHLDDDSSFYATGGTVENGIIAGGPDSFTVLSVLNANGTTYGFWGLYGGTDPCEGGWSCNGDFIPPTESPKPPRWIPPTFPVPPTIPPGPTPPGPPTGPPGGCVGDDCSEECDPYSTYLINLGLSSMGITDAITSMATDVSRQADTARLHYKLEIDAVLRAYPWKFATRYATLVLVEGDPAEPDNPDWVYRYALPMDCLLVRRIVPDRPSTDPLLRQFSPAPIPFAYVESDSSLPFLVTDQGPEVKIEYTARPPCPAKVRDPIYNRACTWRLAHAFAIPLGRDKAQMESAYALYEQQIALAQARDTNEQQPTQPSGRYLDPGGLTTDCAEGCVEHSTRLTNLALSSIGAPETIIHLKTDPSRPAMLARLHFKAEIDAVLRAHPWKFATRYATLVNIVESDVVLPLDINPDEVLAHPEWAHQYVLPTDCLLVRRIVSVVPTDHVAGTTVPDYQRQFIETTVPYDYVESDSGTPYLMSNHAPVTIEYTARIPCPARVRDPIFIRACAWRLAHALAQPLQVEKPKSDQAYQLYLQQINEAQARDQNEQQPQNPVHIGEAEWIRGRQ